MDTNPVITPERLKEDLEHLKEWIGKQPHLPDVEDEEWLTTFLFHNKFSLEKTKHKLDGYFSVRSRYPEIMKNRDPTSSDISTARKAYNQSIASKLTNKGEQMLFARPQADPSIFNPTIHLKRTFMLCDLIYLEHWRHNSVVTVTDCQHLSYQHFLRGFSGIKIGADIFLSAYTERAKAVHIINAPAYINTIVDAVKRVIPRKYADRFFIHASLDSLRKMVDEDILCSDFGGRGPCLAEYDEYTRELLEKHKKWFLEQDEVCSNELLRIKDGNELEELKGSFRKLDVD